MTLLAVVGPTAVGKTRLAVSLARRFHGEIINADSRQVYRHMDIGTAKPTPDERRQAPHHLLDLVDPHETFSLGEFLTLARGALAEVQGRGCLPLLVGGTGQYIWALQEGWQVPAVPPDPAFRAAKEQEAAREGPEALYRELERVAPARAAQLDPRNLRRVVRALEVHHLSGESRSGHREKSGPDLDCLVLGLTLPREELYRRIDLRVDEMVAGGLEAECRRLGGMGYTLGQGPLASPGYLEMGHYLAGEVSLEEAVQRTKYRTHRMARRQYTWFKLEDPRIRWLDAAAPDLEEHAAVLVEDFLQGGLGPTR